MRHSERDSLLVRVPPLSRLDAPGRTTMPRRPPNSAVNSRSAAPGMRCLHQYNTDREKQQHARQSRKQCCHLAVRPLHETSRYVPTRCMHWNWGPPLQPRGTIASMSLEVCMQCAGTYTMSEAGTLLVTPHSVATGLNRGVGSTATLAARRHGETHMERTQLSRNDAEGLHSIHRTSREHRPGTQAGGKG